jgi:C4-dicarboxylate transporter DctQ subunit
MHMKLLGKIWSYFEEICIVVMLVTMAALNLANVASRYVLHASLSWSDEVIMLGFVWVTFFGIAVAYKRGANLGMDLISSHVPPKARVVFILISAACSLIFTGLMIYYSVPMIRGILNTGEKLPITGVPAWFAKGAVPTGGVLMTIRILYWAIIECIKEITGKSIILSEPVPSENSEVNLAQVEEGK